MSFHSEDRDKVRKGTVINLFGQIAGASQGVYLFLARYLFGGEQFGLFIIAYNLVELLSRFFIGGFGDGIIYFSARYANTSTREGEKNRTEKLYASLAACFFWPVISSLLTAVLFQLAAAWMFKAFWTNHDPLLLDLLRLLSWGLPLAVLVRLPVQAVKGHMEMKWSVLVENTLLPVFTLTAAFFYRQFEFDARGLVYAYLLAHLLCLFPAYYGYARYFSLTQTFKFIFTGRFDRAVLKFSLPQSVNMMFNYGMTRVDSLMLSFFVSANLVGIYSLVAELARSIRSVKTSFSTVFAPLVAKYKEEANRQGMEQAINAITRWTASLCIPLLFGVMAFYPDIISGPGAPWRLSLIFPWMVCLGPCMSCFFGLAGNLLLMTGHTRLLLLNSFAMFGMNIGLNLLFIPFLGLAGAALATMTANFFISVLQIIEMGKLEKIAFKMATYTKILTLSFLLIGPVFIMNTPLGHNFFFGFGAIAGLALKIACFIGILLLYTGGLFLWPGANPEKDWLSNRISAWRHPA